MIYFNRPALVGNELKYIQDAVAQGMLCGDGKYTKLCSAWMKERFQVNQVFLTTSCTHALEMAAFLSDIQPGDEVIMPSYTFVSTADAFVLRGAKIVFVDIRPDTMNIDENLIEDAITEKTRAIVPVHYAGVGCEKQRKRCCRHKAYCFHKNSCDHIRQNRRKCIRNSPYNISYRRVIPYRK